MRTYKSFGDYIAKKRHDRSETVRALAEKTGISPGYYGDIEKGRRVPPENGFLEKLIDVFFLNEEQQIILYDLAGKARKEVSPDLPNYIMENEVVRVALRLAKEKADSVDWQRFIDNLEKK